MNGKEVPFLYENRGVFLPQEIDSIPESSGVYLMKDKGGKILYVGKAKNLKKRVSSYFQKQSGNDYGKTRLLVSNISSIDIIITENESEALILEANLIKEYQPRYNIDFKDNKFYPFVGISIKETFPRIFISRDLKKEGCINFGPYTSARAVRQYIDLIQRLFKIRTCVQMPKRECLNYHINRCTGPCIGSISKEEYCKNIDQAIQLLEGNTANLLEELTREMKEASDRLQFEKAQEIKEKIEAIHLFEESQNVFMEAGVNEDYIGHFSKMGKIVFVASLIRNGKMVGKKSYSASIEVEEDLEDIIALFLMEYDKESDGRAMAYVIEPRFENILEKVNHYFQKTGRKTMVRVASTDRENAIIRMATENAALHISQIITKVNASEGLKLLQQLLELDVLPMRIEGFDIANILGQYAVASLVSFYAGKPDKDNYRRFKIKTKETPDDPAMIYEAVYRRYKRLKEENQEFPDLVLIDGGKTQLNAALRALADLNIGLNVISLAKKEEKIYTPYKQEPVVLGKNSPALHILQRVRDETHRFANTYYNALKNKGVLKSIFDELEGVGEKRKEIIIRDFLNYDIIKTLKLEDLVKKGIPLKVAERIYNKIKRLIKK